MKIHAVLSTLLCLLTAHASFAADTLTLAKPDGSIVQIYTTADAPPPVVFASQELQHYLQQITGRTVDVIHELPADSAQPVIILGDTPATREAGIDPSNYVRDEFTLAIKGSRLFVVGKDDATDKSTLILEFLKNPVGPSPSKDEAYMRYDPSRWDFDRGTLNGTYKLLELLGVRWFFPGPKGEVVPHQPDLKLTLDGVLTEKPHYELGVIGSYYADGGNLKNKLDREEYAALEWTGEQNLLWILRVRQPSQWKAFNHRSPRHLWEKRFGETHPEYFALLKNGRRDLKPVPGRTGHLCFTNEGMYEQTLSDIRAFWSGKSAQEQGLPVREDRPYTNNRGWDSAVSYSDTFSLLPHDSYRACYEPGCAALNREDLPSWRQHSGPIWHFVDRVARQMEKEYPDHYITCLAYSSYTGVPADLTSLPDNVIIGLCPEYLNKTSNDVSEENYAKYMKLVREWDAMNAMPLLIWGHCLYRTAQPQHVGVPMMLPNHEGRFFRDLAPHARWMYIQDDADSPLMEQLNRYVMSRLCWQPDLDVDNLLDDYAVSYYGDAAPVMRTFFKDIEQKSEQIAANNAGRVDIWEKYYPEEQLNQYKEQLAQAKAATADPQVAERIDLVEKFILGRMQAGFADYVRNVRDLRTDRLSSCTIRTLRHPIKLDGVLEDEEWDYSSKMPFYNNVNGEEPLLPSRVRMLRSPEDLYFAFICTDPRTQDRLKNGDSLGSVEVFLDPQNNRDSYYQLMVDLNTGKITAENRYEGGGELPTPWTSGAQAAVYHDSTQTTVEIRLPRGSMNEGLLERAYQPWGANFCRSTPDAPRPEDTYSCFSPMMRGSFHQPDLFGHIVFQK